MFLPREFLGERSLAGSSGGKEEGGKESDMTERLTHTHTNKSYPQDLRVPQFPTVFEEASQGQAS